MTKREQKHIRAHMLRPWRITMIRAPLITNETLECWQMDIRKILADSPIKDRLDEDSEKWFAQRTVYAPPTREQ